MITEELYKKALHIVKSYKSEQLLIHNVVGRSEELVCDCIPDPLCRIEKGKVICNGCNNERK